MSDFTCARIAEILGVTKRAVQRIASKHGWQYINNTGLGGQTRVYYFHSLTKDQRHNFIGKLHAYHLSQSKIDNSKVYKFTPTFYQETQEYTKKLNRNNLDYNVSNHVFCGDTTGLIITSEFVKIGLVAMAFTYALQHNQTKSKAYEKFSELYNSKSLGICERVYRRVNRFCSASLLAKPLSFQHFRWLGL